MLFAENLMNLFIRKLTFDEAAEAGRILAASMMIEPGYVAVLPDEAVRQRILVSLVTDSVHEAMAHDAAFGAFDGDRLVGASLWLPPGVYPPPPLPDNAGPPPLPPYLQDLDEQVVRGLIVYDESCVRHFPDEPAWYLMYLGVDPAAQGNGIGSMLLRESLDHVLERDGSPVYLETGTERNVRFYERFGFQVRESGVQLVPGPTRHWTMLRPVPARV
jgi:ribosomal protein S18 acetylase RimI-like enzyme